MSVNLIKLKNQNKKGGNIDIVKLLNKLPFQLHLPNHNYTGPNTNLLLNIEKGIKPYNKLDEAALNHDIEYHENKDLINRHKADEVLENQANEIVKNSSNLKEKAEGVLVSGLMNLKRKIGMGIEDEIDVIEKFNNFLKLNSDKINVEKFEKPEKIEFNEYLILYDLCQRYDLKLLYDINNIKYEDEDHKNRIKKLLKKLTIN